ncbi:MAG: hypothetical protein FWE86_00555, partial [Oscillospiraceae bacterium]|nr:hypothetical protein [Oscillospiraceae bacterium]
MKNMKKTIALLLAVIMMTAAFSGCGLFAESLSERYFFHSATNADKTENEYFTNTYLLEELYLDFAKGGKVTAKLPGHDRIYAGTYVKDDYEITANFTEPEEKQLKLDRRGETLRWYDDAEDVYLFFSQDPPPPIDPLKGWNVDVWVSANDPDYPDAMSPKRVDDPENYILVTDYNGVQCITAKDGGTLSRDINVEPGYRYKVTAKYVIADRAKIEENYIYENGQLYVERGGGRYQTVQMRAAYIQMRATYKFYGEDVYDADYSAHEVWTTFEDIDGIYTAIVECTFLLGEHQNSKGYINFGRIAGESLIYDVQIEREKLICEDTTKWNLAVILFKNFDGKVYKQDPKAVDSGDFEYKHSRDFKASFSDKDIKYYTDLTNWLPDMFEEVSGGKMSVDSAVLVVEEPVKEMYGAVIQRAADGKKDPTRTEWGFSLIGESSLTF